MINVIGLGYIGLPTALMLASSGLEIVGTDYNKELVDTLNAGKTTFKEDGLDELFKKAVSNGIKFTNEYQNTNAYIVSVPTPYDEKTKEVDLKYVIAAVNEVLKVCKDDTILVIESTVSVGSIERDIRSIVNKCTKKIHLVHAPERIIPGNMVYELEHNSRTIGADDKDIGEKVKSFYASFCKGDIVVTDIATAEMTKVVENTYRAINIAFANELTKICHENGMNVDEVIKICNMHPRVNILSPGPGVGGHCIPIDPWFLVGGFPNLAVLTKTALTINEQMPEYVFDRIKEIMLSNNISDFTRVGIYGLTYKENVDDVRESPTLQLINVANKANASFKFYDPFIEKDMVENQYHDFNTFIDDVDMVVVMIGHNEIKEKQQALSGKVVLDTRNVLSIEKVNRI